MELILGLGLGTKNFILSCAELLKRETVPGWVSFVLLLLLVAFGIGLFVKTKREKAALNWLRKLVAPAKDEAEFATKFHGLNGIVSQNRLSKRRQVAFAWNEYQETLIEWETDGQLIIRNAVRPNMFFNLEDLHFTPGFFRILPSLFVTVGLSLTFLGLIAALQSLGQGQELNTAAMQTLLVVASAKFIMSLTGLFVRLSSQSACGSHRA